MFEELKLAIQRDVNLANELLKTDVPPRKFEIVEQPKFIKVFEVDRYTDLPPSVTFLLSDRVIRVTNGVTKEKLFDITIGLNDDGDCNFIVDEKERDSWQIRRRSLESLFFRAETN